MMVIFRILATVIITAAIAILGVAAFVSVGAYDVAAIHKDSELTRWALHSTMQRSVAQRAKSIEAPAQFAEEQTSEGALDFREMCVGCHGAPGEERGEIGKGLNPSPPNLAEVVPNWSSAEIFWILKNGIRMTGMPAFGPTHSDARLWSIVAFVMELPKMTADDYRKIERPAREHEHEHEHQH